MFDLSDVSLPFNVGDLLSTGTQLIGFVSSFVLLVLAFRFVPKLLAVIKDTVELRNYYNERYSSDEDWYGGRKPRGVEMWKHAYYAGKRDRRDSKYQ